MVIEFGQILFLRLSPVIVGALVAKWATGYPYPSSNTESFRLIFGLVGGGTSTLMYGATKSMVKGYMQGIAAGIVNATSTTTTTITPAPTVTITSNTGIGMGQNGNEGQ